MQITHVGWRALANAKNTMVQSLILKRASTSRPPAHSAIHQNHDRGRNHRGCKMSPGCADRRDEQPPFSSSAVVVGLIAAST